MNWFNEPLPHLHDTEPARWFKPDSLNGKTTLDVTPAEWTHVCSARFGEARKCSTDTGAGWTGDSYRYDVFTRRDDIGRPLVAVRWSHGGGHGWLVTENKARRGEVCLILTIAAMPDEAQRWDALHFICEAIDATERTAKQNEYKRLAAAFVDGRLKKRKVRGKPEYDVTIGSN